MRKSKAVAKSECEVKHIFGCNGAGVIRLTGNKKGDPVFNCCLGCAAMLRRQGVKLKQAD